MRALLKSIQVTGIVLCVFGVFLALALFSFRKSLFDWLVFSSIFLPVVFLCGYRFRLCALGVLLIGVSLALSPLDFLVRSERGESGLQIRPVAFGFVSPPGTINYGCTIQRNPPKKALVLFI